MTLIFLFFIFYFPVISLCMYHECEVLVVDSWFSLVSVLLFDCLHLFPVPPPHTHTHVSHPYLESGHPLHCSQSAFTRGFFQDYAKASGESITRTVKKCQSKAHKQKHSGQSDITKGDKGAHLWFWKTKFPFSLSTCKCRNSDLHNLQFSAIPSTIYERIKGQNKF